jgi:ankyrin repeat protein
MKKEMIKLIAFIRSFALWPIAFCLSFSQVSLAQTAADLQAAARDPESLILAARAGDADLLIALIQAGADVNAVDSTGLTALAYAAFDDEPQVAEILLRSGADMYAVSSLDASPPVIAVLSRSAQTLRVLLANGLDPTIYNRVLTFAAVRGDDSMVALIAATAQLSADDVIAIKKYFLKVNKRQFYAGVDSKLVLEIVQACRDDWKFEHESCLSYARKLAPWHPR